MNHSDMPTELTPISPVQIQGDTLGLDFGSSNWLLTGDTKLHCRDADHSIFSRASSRLSFDAPIQHEFLIGGAVQVSIKSGTFEPSVTNDIDFGTLSKEFKDAFFSGAVLASTYESDVTTGTAPFTVASTTEVANLRSASAATATSATNADDADTVDGLHVATSGGAIPDMSAANTWGGAQTFSGSTKLLFGGTTEFIHQSAASTLLFAATGAITFNVGGGAVDLTLLSVGVIIGGFCQASTLKSVVADGTAPIVVTSETECTKLNAAKVGGKTAAELDPLTTKGDISGYSTVTARIPVGTNGQVLTADSTKALGVKWATP